MTANKQAGSARTTRTASIIVLFFAVVFLFSGQSMYQSGSRPGATAQELQANGLQGTVTDARASIGRVDGRWQCVALELTFMGTDGSEHTLETTHYPQFFPGLDSTRGWTEEFPTKPDVVGQNVSYRLGDHAAVELDSEIPALLNAGWGMLNYLGLAFMLMGAGAAVGAVAALVRSRRHLQEADI